MIVKLTLKRDVESTVHHGHRQRDHVMCEWYTVKYRQSAPSRESAPP